LEPHEKTSCGGGLDYLQECINQNYKRWTLKVEWQWPDSAQRPQTINWNLVFPFQVLWERNNWYISILMLGVNNLEKNIYSDLVFFFFCREPRKIQVIVLKSLKEKYSERIDHWFEIKKIPNNSVMGTRAWFRFL
jgi:hypothetical protein